MPRIERFLKQDASDVALFEDTVAMLGQVALSS
jgi:hypothetical protein